MAPLKSYNQNGFALIEVIVSISIAAILLFAFASLNIRSATLSRSNMSEVRAGLYVRELIEITKDLEQSNWPGLIACANPCHPEASGNAWVLAGGNDIVGGFTREIRIETVTGTVDDANTRKAVAKVSWHNGLSDRELVLESFLHKSD